MFFKSLVILRRFSNEKMKKLSALKKTLLLALTAAGIFLVWQAAKTYSGGRTPEVIEFIKHPDAHLEWMVKSGAICNSAVFIQPTDGFIGYLWGDSFKLLRKHQGIDIFGGSEPGVTSVFAPYDGFVSREESWKSSLIIRVPQDPLHPENQIWLYLTHMADAQGNSLIDSRFPPGTVEKAVKAGEILGTQGNYSGDPANPVGVHLHFSIVQDDGHGMYLNELKITNTLDPSPYFNLSLNAGTAKKGAPTCKLPNLD